MLKLRKRLHADRGLRAIERLAEIEASVVGLGNEDLLDLADIFREQSQTPLAQFTRDEMQKRGIKL